LNKLNERSQNVLDKGLQRLAKGALGASDENGIQAHDDQAFDLINKYVLSEAKFDGKDADAMYDKYLSYAGVDLEKARASENQEVPGAKPGYKMEDAEMYAENDTGTISDAGGTGAPEKVNTPSETSSAQHVREMEKKPIHHSKKGGVDQDTKPREWTPQDAIYTARKYVGSKDWSKWTSKDNYPFSTAKCNKFVYDVLTEHGAQVPLIHHGDGSKSDEKYPPVAKDWANKELEIEGWGFVDAPQPGDVAAFDGHVGVVSKNGETISASSKTNTVVENDWGFRTQQKGKMVFRRYTGINKEE
jgi:cell wall-associated NlpC family hydrolase